jgi:hypothetical protein
MGYTIFWTFFPQLQAFSMIYIKDSQDPIQSISKLQNMIVASINQVVLPSFLPIMVTPNDWN